jgi:L-ascorbate metabolism protein UlaG (beta-lactamase superfamily)
MKITYLAHASFQITTAEGVRIITDPYDESVGYRMPGQSADIVTSSHSHFDHAYFKAVSGKYEKLTAPGEKTVKNIRFKGIATAHDEAGGSKRGSNVAFLMEIDGLRTAHLGDLGHIPDDRQYAEMTSLGPVDILMIPVGGYFTIGASEAKKIIEHLNASVMIPMHYRTPAVSLPIAPVEDFTKLFDKVDRRGISEMELTRDSLPPETLITVLEPLYLK